ncbi:MAG: tetratricopeptide repeat protein [Thermoanaerobaculaceae bacterium]|nr:tetratricopeptide repeat protein [Thermoanaerobaculaceae bacterium]TAM56717.1 MAG: tetratricopeptide repeat protein [Acidobacteriota bacterium]
MKRAVPFGLAALLVAAVVAAYLPALRAGFVWNDDTYLTNNRTLDGGAGLHAIWADPRANEQYYPLVFSSFWVEKRLWGLRPLGYHLVNVLLHAASALLLWRLLRRLAAPGAWFGAALFALHPVCVESVAWVTERKNTLSLLLSLLAALAYLAWSERRAAVAGGSARRDHAPDLLPWYRRPGALYAGALALFALALLAKTTAALLPAVLLVLAWWRAGRLRGANVRPLVPFFAIGAALALNTAWLETTVVRASGSEWSLSPAGHLVLAGRAVAFYAGKLLWPTDLAFIYPRWTIDAAAVRQWPPVLAVLAVLAAAWALRRKLGRGPLAAVLLFGGVLVPALGFFNVYAMRYSWVADHFAYQAVAVGAACVAAAVATLAGPSLARRRAAAAAGVAVLAAFGTLTFRHAEEFASAETLWRATLARNPGCFMCHTNYGFLLYRQGRVADAIDHFRASLRLKPDNVPALLNLAKVDEDRGRLDEAASELRQALAVDPADPTVLVNLGTVCTKAGRYEDAIGAYRDALRHPSPDDYLAHNGLGVALIRQGRRTEAVEEFREALRLKPDYWMARANLERALAAPPAAGTGGGGPGGRSRPLDPVGGG